MLTQNAEPIPGYRLQRKLGQGSFGQVWLATAPGNTSMALKFISLQSCGTGLRELQALRMMKGIRHPHILPITALWLLDQQGNVLADDAFDDLHCDSGTLPDGTLADESTEPTLLVVASVAGEQNLGDRLQDFQDAGSAGIPLAELLRHMDYAAEGIDFLNSPRHLLGSGPVAIRHGDIKPENILLLGGAAVVCDFGLARSLQTEAALSRATQAEYRGGNRPLNLLGSPAYMAPELIEGRDATARSDQYSLAITYYHLRTGRLPFPAHADWTSVLDCHRQGRLDLTSLGTAERNVLARATAIDPDNRFGSCREFIHQLARVASSEDMLDDAEDWEVASLFQADAAWSEDALASRETVVTPATSTRNGLESSSRQIAHPKRRKPSLREIAWKILMTVLLLSVTLAAGVAVWKWEQLLAGILKFVGGG